ncbi:GNAT family N-acetyltransferase [Catenulispora sp. NF23]|uniref:GNAT family N-acetyltransferase n=1 Tax=Catenulispora pinistramenti TaxID=2705254 RepID=A0ABS5KHS8_9ACTN|nr:GNAT family N-acetyltransferase [Catenulispora pinistramenti]MBS2531165.1 GNAT family N-acetyltransferase [Catenulispora pinistramenti]MBS2545927.1 GNAT family N-acetyltransferase [Catenulispora pinistramenti]
MPVEISLFDPFSASDADFAEHYGVMTAVMGLDHPRQSLPTLEEYVTQTRQPEAATRPKERWVAREDGRIIGSAYAAYPELENRHMATVRVIVTPTWRRQGIGTALLRVILPALRARGRTVVVGEGVKADASGDLWAREMGFAQTHAYVRQILNVPEAAPGLWQRPVSDGFRLERWIGGAPEELLEQYARGRSAILDAPIGDSTIEFEDWTPERVRAHEADLRARNVENRVVVAVQESSGRVAAITEIQLFASKPDWAGQGDTAVAADFRGHGLGLAVKGAMLRWLTAERPAIATISTHTAQDNAHMISINHALGYTTTATLAEFEADIAAVTKRVESR